MQASPEPPDPFDDDPYEQRTCPFRYSHNCLVHLDSWPEVLVHLQAEHKGQWPGQGPRTEPFLNQHPWPDAPVSYELDALTPERLDTILADLRTDALDARRQYVVIEATT